MNSAYLNTHKLNHFALISVQKMVTNMVTNMVTDMVTNMVTYMVTNMVTKMVKLHWMIYIH